MDKGSITGAVGMFLVIGGAAIIALLIAAAAAAVYTAGVLMEHVPQPPKKAAKKAKKIGRHFGRLRWRLNIKEHRDCHACCLNCKYYEHCLYETRESEGE